MLRLILFQITTGVGLDLLSLEGFIIIRATCINNGWTPKISYRGVEDKDVVCMDKMSKHYVS